MKSWRSFLPSSFRTQIVLVLNGLVALAIFGVVGISQQRISSGYRRMFSQQFSQQLAFVRRAQQLRFDEVRLACRDLVTSVRVLAAFEDGDAENLYKVAADELTLRHLSTNGDTADDSRTPRFFRFISKDSAVIAPPDEGPGITTGPYAASLEKNLTKLHSFMESDKTEVFGNMLLTAEGSSSRDKPQLLEIVVTKAIDPASGTMFGALVIGFPAQFEGSSGLLIEGQLFSPSVDTADRTALTRVLLDELKKAPQGGEILFDGIHEPQEVFYSLLSNRSVFSQVHQIGLFSRSSEEQERESMLYTIAILGGSILVVSWCLSLLLASELSNPIRDLIEGTSRVRQGNFMTPVPTDRLDEIGNLINAFNEMSSDLALKEKYRSVLDVVADKNVAEALIKGDIKLGGESLTASALFCDIRGFTALTENMNPVEVIEMLNSHMTALTKVVYEHGGVVDKFVGDLIMAVFGVPSNTEHDALNAARCALKMIEVRRELNRSDSIAIEMGIGVATGEVVAGCMGSLDRLNYTVLGERVNLASRLCSAAASMRGGRHR